MRLVARAPWSEVSINGRSFTSMPSIGTPTLVSPANGATVSGASVSFEWSAVADAVNYRLLVSTSTNILDTTKYKRNYVYGQRGHYHLYRHGVSGQWHQVLLVGLGLCC